MGTLRSIGPSGPDVGSGACPPQLDTGGRADTIPQGAVQKAFQVLSAFPPGPATVGVSELSRRCGLAKSTTHRILQILESTGAVEHAPSGYRLGSRIVELADMAVGRKLWQLRDCVLPYLLDLYEETHLTVHFGVWSGSGMLIVETLHGRNGVTTQWRVGTMAPAHCTALGKAFLAFADDVTQSLIVDTPVTTSRELREELRAIRQEGVAFSSNEFLPGVASVATPVWGSRRSVVAAISVSGPRERLDAYATRQVRLAAHATSISPCCAGDPAGN